MTTCGRPNTAAAPEHVQQWFTQGGQSTALVWWGGRGGGGGGTTHDALLERNDLGRGKPAECGHQNLVGGFPGQHVGKL
jgi:hypothetical protein